VEIQLSSDHIYTVDGIQKPSFSEIKDTVYGHYPYPEGAAERGHHVHLATQLFDENDLDEATLDPVVAGYLEGWKLFREEMDFNPLQIEMKVYNPTYGYCGTLDRIGTFRDKPNNRKALIDIKSGAKEWHHPLQSMAYAACLDEPHDRYALYLSADGKYKLVAHTRRADLQDWLCTVRVYQIKKENNV
jgi:hypothetical protein